MAATTKDELLGEAAREYKALRGLNETQMTEVWLGTWSVRDIVAHITGWHQEMGPALERLARGERPIPEGVSYDDNVDAWNERFAAARRSTAVADVLLELDKSHEHFLKVAAVVPTERFQPGKTAWKIVDLNGGHHYRLSPAPRADPGLAVRPRGLITGRRHRPCCTEGNDARLAGGRRAHAPAGEPGGRSPGIRDDLDGLRAAVRLP